MELFREEKEDIQTPTVYCDVKNCSYHNGDDICTAHKIHVGPVHAISSTDTTCVTFKPGNK